MPKSLVYTGRLIVTSCWCGIGLAVPTELYDLARRKKDTTIYCPVGHTFIYSNTTEERLEQAKRELEQERRRWRATADLLEHESRSHAATKGHVTRKKKQLERVAAGVCPCCTRSFQDLRRHMKTKHPDYVA